MSRLLKIEFIKIRKSLAFKVTLLICALMCLMDVGLYVVMSSFTNLAEEVLDMSINGYTMFYSCVTNPSDILMLSTIVACIIIGGDFASRTLQSQIVAGYSRTQIVISRFISSFVLLFVFATVYTLIIFGGVTLFVGFGIPFTAKILGEMLVSFFMSVFMSYAIMTLYLLIIFIFKSVGPSLGVTMPVMLVGTSIIQILASLNDITGKIVSFTPSGQLFALKDISFDASFGAMGYFKFFAVGLVYVAIMITTVIFTFRKAELK